MEKKLSIVCITYNQAKFIRQCLDSFLMQETDFKYEVLINDDASTDGTKEIIEEYAKKYPDIIKPVLRDENIGAIRNFVDTLSRVKTKYAAVCEGDDYWTDKNKLQKQVDFLETHPEYSGCFHPVRVVWENKENEDSVFPTAKMIGKKKFVTKEDMLKCNYIQTNSVVYRWRFTDTDIKEIFPMGILPGDWYLHLLHAQTGKIAYLPDIMADYRKQSGGIWYDGKNIQLKYGVESTKFYYSVWKNFTESSGKYLHRTFLPVLKSISDNYYKNDKYDKLKELKDAYGELYIQAINTDDTLKKYKKYKKLANIFIIISVLALVLNLLQFLYFLTSSLSG